MGQYEKTTEATSTEIENKFSFEQIVYMIVDLERTPHMVMGIVFRQHSIEYIISDRYSDEKVVRECEIKKRMP